MAYGDFEYLAKRNFLMKSSVIRRLILLKIQNMMDIKEVLLLWQWC